MLLDLPAIPLPGWVAGHHAARPGRPASRCSPACTTGCGWPRIVICVGAANALANPKRLLRSVPPALYEIGTALVVARVRAARSSPTACGGSAPRRRCAAGEPAGSARLRRLLVPVLEDALERSLALAAGMDARGYGRTGDLGRGRRRATGDAHARRPGRHLRRRLRRPRPHRARAGWRCRCWPLGALVARSPGCVSAGRRVRAHALPPRPLALARARGRWRGGVVAAAAAAWVATAQPSVAFPRSPRCPTVSGAALAGRSWPRWPAGCARPPPVLPAAARSRRRRCRPDPPEVAA